MSHEDDDDDLPPGINIPGITQVAHADEEAVVLPRCWPELDTAATAGDRRGDAWICIEWANGRCPHGTACEALHRLPSMAEEQRLVYSVDGLDRDVFGRAGHGTQATTMLVRGLPGAASQRAVRAALDGFSEYGQVVRTWVHHEPGAGYVAFKWKCAAQFVMEAMQGRSLEPEGGEPLALSWALRDPGQEQAEQARSLALRSMEEARARRDEQHEMYAKLEAEGLALKRRRLGHAQEEGGGAGAGAGAGVGGGYGRAAAAEEETGDDDEAPPAWARWAEAPEQDLTAVTALYPGAETDAFDDPAAAAESAGDTAPSAAAAEGDGADLPEGWTWALDPRYNAAYYIHAGSGRTQWERPDAES